MRYERTDLMCREEISPDIIVFYEDIRKKELEIKLFQ